MHINRWLYLNEPNISVVKLEKSVFVMPKDRLAELHGKNGGHQRCEEDLLLEVCTHQSKFYDKTKKIEESLWNVQEQMSQLKILQESILSSPTTESYSKEKMDGLSKSITSSMKQIGMNLKDWKQSAAKDFRNRKLTETEYRMINNMQSSLTIRFQAKWDELCSIRNAYESKCKRRIQRQLEIAGYDMEDDEIETALTSGISVFAKQFGECEAAKLALRDLEDRHQELLGLEKNIQEMHDLFIELNVFVECQGEVVDRIEMNITQAAGNVEDGKQCLQEARQKQTSFRKKKIVCTAIAVGVLALAVVITISILFG